MGKKSIPDEWRLSRVKWHALNEEEVLERLQTNRHGLSEDVVNERQRQYGPNTLPGKKVPGIWEIILHQVINPLIFILLVAAAASVVIKEYTDAFFILFVIALNTALGAYQEYKAEKSAASLHQLLKIHAKVKRQGKNVQIPAEELVPGDIIFLESGNKVPADIRLLEAHNLNADESFLTGESLAAEKHIGILPEETAVPERSNMLFAGSTIMSGRAMGVITGTGTDTQVGLIAKSLAEAESAKPPLVLRMEKFTRHVSLAVVALCLIIAFLLKNKGMENAEIFFFVVALAVSAIPEGLPVAMTVVLSIASKRMSQRNVIVKKLTAVESLGSCTVIASDKTGTLTVNQQTAKRILLPDNTLFQVTGEGYNGNGVVLDASGGNLSDVSVIQDIIRTAVLANEGQLKKKGDTWEHIGDAMDVALLGLALKAGTEPEGLLSSLQMAGKIPYESEQKFSASCYTGNGKVYYAAKGAVETILHFCTTASYGGKEMPLNKATIEQQVNQLAEEGYRVLGFAGKVVKEDSERHCFGPGDLCSLTFYGLVGFIDPLRPEAVEAVDKCKKAGIKVIMITGDHPVTSKAIAGELRLSEVGDSVVTGQMLSEAGSHFGKAFSDLVMSTHVFARVTPAQKLQIVDVLIRHGEFVAVTGDGVNDTPALRRANIGVAMGSGTDVAKDVGTMIVTDDNFSSIVAGVEEGRFAYGNVRKVILLLISTGLGSVILVLGSIFANLPLPLLAVQFLWLNLVTNGIQDVALGFEAGEKGAMQKKPRKPTEPIFDRALITQTLLAGIVMGLIALTAWHWLLHHTTYSESAARNILFLLLVLFGNLHVFNCRSEQVSAFRIPISNNYILIIGVIISQGVHIACMHIPFMQKTLHIEPVSLTYWMICLAIAFSIILLMEAYKMIRRSWFTEK